MHDTGSKLLIDADGAPIDRICGFETEYGFNCDIGPTRYNDSKDTVAKLVARSALQETASQYQESGERTYVDVGVHPELSTAEETSFINAAHRVVAGHVKMATRYKRAAESIKEFLQSEEYPAIKQVNLIANTTDLNGNSWGSHENMLSTRALRQDDFIYPLAIHHLSRIVWSGAGMVLPGENNKGFRFTLSEKANHIWEIASSNTVRSRPLVNLRDNPYADWRKYRRIHTVAGESLMNPFTNALRLASGSIVLRACELSVIFDDLIPENPIKAIREISRDSTLKTKVLLVNGKEITGLDLQRKIAERSIKAASDANYLTSQEKNWGERWLKLLDDLGDDPQKCAKRIDWIVKKNLIDREVEAKQDRDETDFSVAWSKSVDFHRLLPNEGMGMKMIRREFFEDSPSPEVIENGLPLPQNRAMIRAAIIHQLEIIEREHDVDVHWDVIESGDKNKPLYLDDPYATNPDEAMQYIQELKNTAAVA